MTHAELVEKARYWLVVSKGCNPVFLEKGSANHNEFPDAIGWTANACLLVECKSSVADFRADKKKDFRHNGEGLGDYRYFLMPRTIYEKVKDEMPKGWGHLVVDDVYHSEGRTAQQVRSQGSVKHTKSYDGEINFLRSRILEIQRFGT